MGPTPSCVTCPPSPRERWLTRAEIDRGTFSTQVLALVEWGLIAAAGLAEFARATIDGYRA